MTNENLELKVSTRTKTKKQVGELRSADIIPGIVYGHKKENKLIQVDLKKLFEIHSQSGENTLINLTIDEESPVKVLIHSLDLNHVTDAIEHVDFYIVNMDEKIHAEITFNFIGISPAVKALGGVLVKSRDEVSVKCLPQDLISDMDIDISSLATFDDAIHISDLQLPDTIELLDDPGLTIATVMAPRTEEELADLDKQVNEDVSKVAGATEEKEGEESDATDTKESDEKKTEKDDSKS
ncbi:MAG: 50S ribosomal protein L25 [bacterium]|nr:50S ribosomal protein L25 [bacterium]